MFKSLAIASLFITTSAFAAIAEYDYEPEQRMQHDGHMIANVKIQCLDQATGKEVAKTRTANANWHFNGEQSACPQCNPDWCNVHEIACEDQKCKTVIEEDFGY